MILAIYLVGLTIYAIFRGKKEGHAWDLIDAYSSDADVYHLNGLLENIGSIIVGAGLYLMQPTKGWVFLGIGSLLYAFLIYRIAFMFERKQSDLIPQWKWAIYNPFTKKTKRFSYPPTEIVVILGVAGLILICFAAI